MKLSLEKTIAWTEPLEFIHNIPAEENCWALLYSGMHTEMSGGSSFLAMRPRDIIKADDFSKFKQALSDSDNIFNNAWFGYLGYGLKNTLETLPKDRADKLNMPDLWMAQYSLILHFNHNDRAIDIWADRPETLDHLPIPKSQREIKSHTIYSLRSNMSKSEYLDKVHIIKESILRGDLYQANLTRKFFGRFDSEDDPPSPTAIFSELCKQSPSPYSTIMKLENNYIISSSPERFLSIDKHGNANARPIKGSAARNIAADAEQRDSLKNSEKDRAENLMIVDLMRNDLSRTAAPGSVTVDSLFDIDSYSTVHHMSSSINARKMGGASTLDMVKACFPPGSMTGTPKIKAMELCSELEQDARGVYSGAIGWFGGDGSVDLSVVIRTLIMQGEIFEFQVGGAIVADSEAESEWQETLVKARAIARTLGISEDELAEL